MSGAWETLNRPSWPILQNLQSVASLPAAHLHAITAAARGAVGTCGDLPGRGCGRSRFHDAYTPLEAGSPHGRERTHGLMGTLARTRSTTCPGNPWGREPSGVAAPWRK